MFLQKERADHAANAAPANTVVALESRLVREEKARAALEKQLEKEKRARFVLESMLASNGGGGTTTTASSSARSTGFREAETEMDSDSEYSGSGSGSGPVGRQMPHVADMHTITEYEHEEQERAAQQEEDAAVDETAESMARIANEERARKPEEDEAAVDVAAEQMAPTEAEERARRPEDGAAIDEVGETIAQNEMESKPEDKASTSEAYAPAVKKQSQGKKSVTVVGDSDVGQHESSQASKAKVIKNYS